jgi:hypothetical protein
MRIGISIVKSVLFRGVQQEFSNVYYFNLAGAVTGPWDSLINEVKSNETPLHSADVTFKRGSVWSAGGTKEQNQMLFQKPLTGTGSTSANLSMDRERALLFRWPAGLDSRGKPVYLRKWFHVCGNIGGVVLTAGHLQNTQAFTAVDKTTLQNLASTGDEIGVGESWQLCSATGRVPTGGVQAHAYLEHHQLGDAWR